MEKETLRALLARVEAWCPAKNDFFDMRALDLDIHRTTVGPYALPADAMARANALLDLPRYTSSLDAAVALVVRCFPHGWWAIEGDCGNDHTAFTGKVGRQEEDAPSVGDAPTSAVALVTALLRALIKRDAS